MPPVVSYLHALQREDLLDEPPGGLAHTARRSQDAAVHEHLPPGDGADPVVVEDVPPLRRRADGHQVLLAGALELSLRLLPQHKDDVAGEVLRLAAATFGEL